MKKIKDLAFWGSKNSITVLRSKDSGIRQKLATQLALEWATPFQSTILYVPTPPVSSSFCQPVMKGLSNHLYCQRLIPIIDTAAIYEAIVKIQRMTLSINTPIHLICVLEQGTYNGDVAKAFHDMLSLMAFGKKDITICIICDKWNGQKKQILRSTDNNFDIAEVKGEVVLTPMKWGNLGAVCNTIILTVDALNDLQPYRVKP